MSTAPERPASTPRTDSAALPAEVLWPALALALASAVSLGLARFSYGLLLPPMRAELGWSYLLAGAMNTANAAGYLAGALLMPRLLARHDARALMLGGGALSAGLLVLHALLYGGPHGDAALLALRLGTGVGSAASFVGGGLLAARLAGRAPAGARGAGLVLGVYYGGVGLGIVASAWLVPLLLEGFATGWPAAWVMLGTLSALFTALTARGTRALAQPPQRSGPSAVAPHAPWWPMRWLLAGYLMFGLGYIGTMTFLITLLREQGRSGAEVTAYFTLLGLGVMASSWLWAGLLQRHHDGRPMAQLNGLLALATLLPVLSPALPVALLSGALFGAVFLAVVGSTTAFVRHNLAPAAWASGISAYTILFAAGQIVGPGLTGWIADAAGGGATGLRRGLALSAALLALGALLASRQRALGAAPR